MISFVFNRQRLRTLGVAALVVTGMFISPAARAQAVPAGYGAPSDARPETAAAASVPSTTTYHIFPANTEAGRHAALSGAVVQSDAGPAAAAAVVKPLALPRPGFFPADLTYFGGLVAIQISSANIYYNCANQSCWGNPEGFLTDLAVSKFIHVVDPYIGKRTNNRYPFSAESTTLLSGPSSSRTAQNIEDLVHQAASVVGAGHIFHVFLPQGVDVCPVPGVCYSPDNPSTFVFCAYHSSVDFNDLGTVAYTVEPFQNVNGCFLSAPNPNGATIDATNSALSHELFETITDPFSDAWVAENSQLDQGSEIADICHGPGDGFGGTIVPTYTLVKGHTYQTQLEYSNFRHACVATP